MTWHRLPTRTARRNGYKQTVVPVIAGISSGILHDEGHTHAGWDSDGQREAVKFLRTPCSLQRVKEKKKESNHAYMQRMCGLYLKNSYGANKREMWYSRVKRRCIFEELLPLALGRGFKDFKIHMYHNRPMFIQIKSTRIGLIRLHGIHSLRTGRNSHGKLTSKEPM
jgi:hypothetical protein